VAGGGFFVTAGLARRRSTQEEGGRRFCGEKGKGKPQPDGQEKKGDHGVGERAS